MEAMRVLIVDDHALFGAGLDLPKRVKVSLPQLTARMENMRTAQPFALRACQS